MKVVYEKKFLRDLVKLPREIAAIVENFVFDILETYDSVYEIKNLKKLQGHKSAYRIRFGDYRLGFFFENNTVYLDRMIHSSKFYRKFP